MFEHTRLKSPRSIRLARQLASDAFDAPIRLEVFEVDLDDVDLCPPYEALSYVWGAPTATIPLVCDNGVLLVTLNCDSALRHLRLAADHRILWIDAICIDQGITQDAIDERNVQVAMMGEIYGKASGTICWIGEETPYTKEVIRHLNGIGRCPSQRGLRKLMEFEGRLRAIGMIDEETSCLDHIYCHPWHSRIWTVQEVAFSRQCSIVVGYCSIQWEMYYKASYFLIFQQFISSLDTQAARSMVAIDIRNILRNYILGISGLSDDAVDGEHDQERKSLALTSCLTNLNQLRATDAKDKVYGLYALYVHLGVPLSLVNYTKPIAHVYADMTVAMISWSKSLQVLSDTCSQVREPTLPSWVPDWNDATARMVRPCETISRGSPFLHLDRDSLARDLSKLRARGSIVGRVQGLDNGGFSLKFPTRLELNSSDILQGSHYAGVPDIAFLRLLVKKVSCLRDVLGILEAREALLHGDNIDDALHDMLSLGRMTFAERLVAIFLDMLRFPNGTYDQSNGFHLAAQWQTEDDEASAWNAELLNCCTVVATLVIAPDKHAKALQNDLLELLTEISENLGDKTVVCVRLKVNEADHIGTTFCTVQEEDTVVVLEGAEWPVILRPIGVDGEEWLFLGPVHLVGFLEEQDEISPAVQRRPFCLV